MATLVMRVSNGSVYRCEECGDTFTVRAGEKADCPMCKPRAAYPGSDQRMSAIKVEKNVKMWLAIPDERFSFFDMGEGLTGDVDRGSLEPSEAQAIETRVREHYGWKLDPCTGQWI